MSTDKAGSPPCGIYVQINDFSNFLDLIGHVRQMALVVNRASGYEKNMVVVELAYDEATAERLVDLIPIVKDQGFVTIVSDNFEAASKADGILLDDTADVAAAREALGTDAIIGVRCRSRAEAEVAMLANVDYVVMNADPALITWWSSRTDILCVARGKKAITASACGALTMAGAGFVDVSDYILKHKKGVMQGTVNVLNEIEQAASTPKTVN